MQHAFYLNWGYTFIRVLFSYAMGTVSYYVGGSSLSPKLCHFLGIILQRGTVLIVLYMYSFGFCF